MAHIASTEAKRSPESSSSRCRDPVASRCFDDLVTEAQLVIELVAGTQARIAREAYRDFGRDLGFKRDQLAVPTELVAVNIKYMIAKTNSTCGPWSDRAFLKE